MKIFDTQALGLLKKSLDVYTAQHEAIAKNIANADNPDYKRANTDFSQVLKTNMNAHLKVDNPRHIGNPKPVESKADEKSKDTQVDVTREMASLAENQIRYEFASRVLSINYRVLGISIKGHE
ncbi:flagellar basal body rod protein FlgB [candidate division KSB1 bacterium]|jgi:flagellar basal-body rod protein FlgB|nr:MAG: flagellar basal body rod protein FlgB [candidate division KSB1 bacterium]